MLWRNNVPIGLPWSTPGQPTKKIRIRPLKSGLWSLRRSQGESTCTCGGWVRITWSTEHLRKEHSSSSLLQLFSGKRSWLSLEYKGRGPESVIQLTIIAKGEPCLSRNESLCFFVIFLIETCYLCHQCIEVPMINILVLDTNFTRDMVQHQIIVKGIIPGFHLSPSPLLQIDKWMQNPSQSK